MRHQYTLRFHVLALLALHFCWWQCALAKTRISEISEGSHFSSEGMPVALRNALTRVLFKPNVNDDFCRGHIVLTAPPAGEKDVGFADRLRGLVMAAYMAASTQRLLHVHPFLMGTLSDISNLEVATWLKQLADRSMRCNQFAAREQHIHATFQIPGECALSNVMDEVMESKAAVIMLDSNCYNFGLSHAAEAKIPQARIPHVFQVANCLKLHTTANFGTHRGMTSDVYSFDLEKLANQSRSNCPCTRPGWTEYSGAGDPRSLDANHPPHQWHCSAASTTSRCAAFLLHAGWAAEWPRLYSVLQAAERMHARWQKRFAPGGYTVLHLRSASTTLPLSNTCNASSVPWYDPIPDEWESLGTAASRRWLQHLQPKQPPAAPRTNGPPPNIVIMSDSVRLKEAVTRLIGSRANVVSCCSQPAHIAARRGDRPGSAHMQSARQLLFDLVTMARSNVIVAGSGMLWVTGMHWLSWLQGPILAPTWHPDLVQGAAQLLLTPWS